MKHCLHVLDIDKEYAKKQIAKLEKEITDLGPEFRNAFTQTSETWHDNAPFEAVRDQQSVLAAERHHLKQILNKSLPSIPKQPKTKVGIGSRVKIINLHNAKTTEYFIAGDWTYRAGCVVDGYIVMSCRSPLATLLIGKKVGEIIHYKSDLKIENILFDKIV